MSQHKHTTTTKDGKSVTVTLGYDRLLDYVFCTVMQNGEQEGEGDILYSNLGDDEAGTHLQEVDYFRPILSDLGISVPASITNFFDGQSSSQAYGFGLFTFSLVAIPPILILRGLQIRGWTIAAFCLYVVAGC